MCGKRSLNNDVADNREKKCLGCMTANRIIISKELYDPEWGSCGRGMDIATAKSSVSFNVLL